MSFPPSYKWRNGSWEVQGYSTNTEATLWLLNPCSFHHTYRIPLKCKRKMWSVWEKTIKFNSKLTYCNKYSCWFPGLSWVVHGMDHGKHSVLVTLNTPCWWLTSCRPTVATGSLTNPSWWGRERKHWKYIDAYFSIYSIYIFLLHPYNVWCPKSISRSLKIIWLFFFHLDAFFF